MGVITHAGGDYFIGTGLPIKPSRRDASDDRMCIRAGTWSGTFAALALLVTLQILWTGLGIRNGLCGPMPIVPETVPFANWNALWAFPWLWIALVLVLFFAVAVLIRFLRLSDDPKDDADHDRARKQAPAVIFSLVVTATLGAVLWMLATTGRDRCDPAPDIAGWTAPLLTLAILVFVIAVVFAIVTFLSSHPSMAYLFVCCSTDIDDTVAAAPACFGPLPGDAGDRIWFVYVHNASVVLLGLAIGVAIILLERYLAGDLTLLPAIAWVLGIGLTLYAVTTIVVIVVSCLYRREVYGTYSTHALLLSLVLVAGMFVTAFFLTSITAETALSTLTWFIVALVIVMLAFCLLANPASPKSASNAVDRKAALGIADVGAAETAGLATSFAKNVLVNW